MTRASPDDIISKRIAPRDMTDGCAALNDGSLARVVVTLDSVAIGRASMKTITTHYIDGAFVESHGREVMDSSIPRTAS